MNLRLRLAVVAFLTLLTGIVTYDVATGAVAIYTGKDAGVVVGPVGFEWAGHPGFFLCDDQC
jgi:hypothetical protein